MTKALFWDFHGTLTTANHLWSGSIYKAFSSIAPNLNISLDLCRSFTCNGFTWDSPDIDYIDKINDKWWDTTLDMFYKKFINSNIDINIAKQVCSILPSIIQDVNNYELYPDAIETLKQVMEKGYGNYLLSNNYPELDDIMDKLGLSQYFNGSIISAKIGYEKPRPEIYDIALKLANNPDTSYMIGDSLRADIEGGHNAKMKTILVHNNTPSNADYSFNDLISIVSIL